ncbi:hypothetical protein MIN45_P0570 [Methylomarinovum tepidoasis]|uniref:Methyltransferase type 11 domain-containing protein n=1 Tax=Methylomarinovum tepidoasis TaxID=2840183 RepID=A0AAU9C8M6_9GAMM|nr:methyltransferase domain-containing protein [Methylomarinovum sp. IN45]BCX88202.1 hypothetical protein MIN45_P0570 [Methylomarinovum sp. IN45]
MPNQNSRLSALRAWYRAPLGRKIQRLESQYLSRAIQVPYSFTLVQLGATGWEKRYLDSGYWRRFVIVDEGVFPRTPFRTIAAHLDSLPLASECVDVLILPHTLEFTTDQHQLLRESERVLKPEGQLFVLGFHPWSFYRLYRWLPGRRHAIPWSGRAITHRRLLDWLSLLNFCCEVTAWYDFRLLHPCEETGRWHSLGAPLWAVAYAVRAIKRTYTAIPLEPAAESSLSWVPGMVEPTIQRRKNARR